MRTGKRAVGLVVEDSKILIFRRFKEGQNYHAFIGGGIEEGEMPNEAVVREMNEELCIDIEDYKLLFKVETKLDPNYLFGTEKEPERVKKYSPYQYFYLISKYNGIPQLGGEEKERSSKNNQYHLEWVPLSEVENIEDLYPKEAKNMLVKFIKAGKLDK